MRDWGFGSTLVGAFVAFACSNATSSHDGGQAGTAGELPACERLSRVVGLDEQTPVGVARAHIASLPSTLTGVLSWWPPADVLATNGASSTDLVHTTLALSLSGEPTSATYFWMVYSSDGSDCGQHLLEVDGAVLHFQTADGAFDEDIPVQVSFEGPDGGPQPPTLDAWFAPSLAGSYDISAVATHFQNPQLHLHASTFLLSSYLAIGERWSAAGSRIATWLTEGSGSVGASGVDREGAGDAGAGP